MDLDHERRLSETESRSKSNAHRIDKLEKLADAINELATSIAVMAANQERVVESVDNLGGSVEKLDSKVTALEQKPIKRVDGLIDKAIWALCAAVIAFLLSRIGL